MLQWMFNTYEAATSWNQGIAQEDVFLYFILVISIDVHVMFCLVSQEFSLLSHRFLAFNAKSYSSCPSTVGVRLDPERYLLVIFARDSVISRLFL